MGSISNFCQRVVLLENGQVITDGKPAEVIQTYRERQSEVARTAAKRALQADYADDDSAMDEPIITQVEVFDETGMSENMFRPQDRIMVRAHYIAP